MRSAFVFFSALTNFVVMPVASSAQQVQFNRDVRPILSDACFTCHGPDEGQRKGDLRLDTKVGFDDARDIGILPEGRNGDSVLLERITATDPDLRMPPADSGRKLTPKQIAILQQWVKQGAEWQKHWAYIPPQRVTPPAGQGLSLIHI